MVMMPHLPLLRILTFPIWTGTLDNKADLPQLLSLLPLFSQHHLLMIYPKFWAGVGGVRFCPGERGWDSVAWLFTQDFSGPRQPFVSNHLIAPVVEQC